MGCKPLLGSLAPKPVWSQNCFLLTVWGVNLCICIYFGKGESNAGASLPTFLLSVETFVTCNYKFTTTKSDDHAFNGTGLMVYLNL